jgi:hypothetical protein
VHDQNVSVQRARFQLANAPFDQVTEIAKSLLGECPELFYSSAKWKPHPVVIATGSAQPVAVLEERRGLVADAFAAVVQHLDIPRDLRVGLLVGTQKSFSQRSIRYSGDGFTNSYTPPLLFCQYNRMF